MVTLEQNNLVQNDTAQKRSRTQNGAGAEAARKYTQMSGGGISFTVSGSGTRGYVPSQAGLQGLSRNSGMAWRTVYERCVESTKKETTKGRSSSDKQKALRIAHKISEGKRVPRKDEEFLMRYSIMLWMAAKQLAMMKKIGDEVEESELDDEPDDENGDENGDESAAVQEQSAESVSDGNSEV